MRMLASIQEIIDIAPIEGADRIERATVLGWHCVVKKGEFAIGDKCVYFEIDSVLPQEPEFFFLHEAKYRIKTIRLKQQVSQGLCIPLDIAKAIVARFETTWPGDDIDTDLTDVLHIGKWEPQEPNEGGGFHQGQTRCTFPSFIPKTDETRIQSKTNLLYEFRGEECYASVKLDGSSCTYYIKDNVFGVCSRERDISKPAETSFTLPDGTVKTIIPVASDFWNVAMKYNLPEVFPTVFAGRNIAIQGELVGPGIQKNRLGLKEKDFYAFNIFDIDAHCYLGYHDLLELSIKAGLKHVPIAFVGTFDWDDVESLLEFAKGSYADKAVAGNIIDYGFQNHLREGLVFRPLTERYSQALRGRASFKVINNDFLLKIK